MMRQPEVDEGDVYKVTALAHSKLRNELGFVGIEAVASEKKVYVKLARQWSLDDVTDIPKEISDLYDRFHWDNTLVAQSTGEYVIAALKTRGLPVTVITTQKLVKDPKLLQDIKVMDKIEMTEFLRKLKHTKGIFTTGTMTAKNRQTKWESMDKPYTIDWLRRCAAADGPENAPAFVVPPRKPSPHMQVLMEQITMIKQYRTHTGEFTYRAISSRHDDLFMAFLLCCHVARHVIGTRDPASYTNWEDPPH